MSLTSHDRAKENRVIPEFVFVTGVPKGGTTALAGWLVRSGLATYAVPGTKEPATYLRSPTSFFPPAPPAPGGLPLLDATPMYFGNARAVGRLPDQYTRIAVCLRNPLERTWSDYRMRKVLAMDGDGATCFVQRMYQAAAAGSDPGVAEWSGQRLLKALHVMPRSQAHEQKRHFEAETARLMKGNFDQRLEYELSFFMSRQQFPHLSILRYSFYYLGLRQLLNRYQPEDIVVMTRHSLGDAAMRAELGKRLTGRAVAGEAPEHSFTLGDIPFDEPEPDYAAGGFAQLRRMFAFDLEHTLGLLDSAGVATDLVDRDELYRHLR